MARKASFVKGSPLETFNRNFYILALSAVKSSYIAASLLKDNEYLSNDMIKDLEQVEENILSRLSVNIDGPFLRNRFFVKAGKAPKEPFIVSSVSKEASNMTLIARKGDSYKNEAPFILDTTKKYKLADLLDLSLKALENNNIALSDNLKQAIAPNGLKSYYDICQVNVSFEQLAEYSDTVHYKMIIEFAISAKVYPKIIASDEIEQNTYLLSIWLHNCLQASSTRGRQIVDPRRVSSNTRKLSVEYGEAKARVNKEGYALFRTGLPIFIGNGRIDYIDKLMEAGKDSINEDGFFSPESFSGNASLTNKIIYVDWYNDLLVYTSATGLIQTLSLRGTSKLSDVDEWLFLSLPIIEPKLNITNRVVSSILSDVSFEQMKAEYIALGGKEIDLTSDTFRTFSNTYAFIVANSGRESAPNVTWAHIAGFDKENIKADVASRSSYSTASKMLIAITVAQAYFKAFRKLGKSPDSYNLPTALQALGIRAFLEGVYFIINSMAIKSSSDMDILNKAYQDEKSKWEVNKNLTSIKIPNVKVGGKGFNGLLPHQAEIASSLIKNPRYNVLSVSTGGGKCGDKNQLVLTNKGLIKLGELNQMSGEKDSEGFSPLDGIKVLTRKGMKTADKSYHTKGRTVKVNFSDGDLFEGLPEHKILALSEDNTLEYIRLDCLKGKYLPKQNNSNVFPDKLFIISFDTNGYSKQNYTNFNDKNLPTKVDPRFATLLGLIASEGSMCKSTYTIGFTNTDINVLEMYKTTFQELFNIEVSETVKIKDGSKDCFSLRISNKIVREYFEHIFNGHFDSYSVEVPLCIRMSPKKVQASFLRALYDGDGTIYEGDRGGWNIDYTSCSFLLVRQVKVMLSNFGIFSTIRKREMSATNGTEGNSCISYELQISKKSLVTFCNEIGFLSERKQDRANQCLDHYKSLKAFGQDTNRLVHGPDNILPIGSLVRDTMYLIEDLIKDIPYESRCSTSRYSLPWLWRNIKFKPKDNYFEYLGEEINHLTIQKLFKMLRKAPEEVKDVLKSSKLLLKNLSLITKLSSKEWVKVTSVEKGSFKDVYDISVPGPHEYVVDSLMSHNTVTAYINAASAILSDGKTRPLISTKGNLIHNTITEINTITGGQFNAVPFTPTVIRKLKTQAGLKGIKDLMKWVKELPPNTVLINSYSNFGSRSILFEEMPQDEAFADVEIGMSQYNKILRLCNINMIIGDESHLIKNVSSKRTRGAYGAFAAVDYRTIMSGTLISNTAKDLVGQVNGVTPNVFGDNLEKFCDDYNISQTGILSDEDAAMIKKKLTSSVSWQQATPDDWGYMLPDVTEEIVFVKLTQKQEAFYNKILTEALIEIEKNNSSDSEENGDENAEDSDNESEEDENSDDAFIAKISKALMPLEDFLVAPDFNELYVNQIGPDKPSGNDLISPKVAMVDQLITKHFETSKNDANSNKLIVAGWSLNGIRHLQKYSKYADEAVTYFAGDADVIRRYKDDPTVRIMFAAETSIREGENLQCFPGYTHAMIDYNKSVSMRDIYNDDSITHVLAYDLNKKKIVKKEILNKLRHKVKVKDNYLRISFRDQNTGKSSSILCTDEHPFFLKDGSFTEARNLTIGNELITYGGNFNICENINGSYIGGKELYSYKQSQGAKKQQQNPEHKENMRQRMIAYCKTDSWRDAVEKITKAARTPEARKASSEKSKLFWNAGHKEKVLKGLKAYHGSDRHQEMCDRVFRTPEARKKQAERTKKAWESNPNRKEEFSTFIKNWWNEERRALRSEELKERFKDPVFYKKYKKALHEYWESLTFEQLKARKRGTLSEEGRKAIAEASKRNWELNREEHLAKLVKAFNKSSLRKTRSKNSKKMWANRSPEEADRIMQALLKGQDYFPNKPERDVIALDVDHLYYTGDGSFWVGLVIDGKKIRKNPDFIYRIRGQKRPKKVVEVIGARKYTNRDAEYDKKLIRAYAEVGIECLIVDAEDTETPELKGRLESFVNNHYLTITKIVKVDSSSEKASDDGYKYDLTVAGTHNYFVVSNHEIEKQRIPVLVHNCSSRILKITGNWSPGGHTQLRARMYRPDPRGVYNRDSVSHTWIMSEKINSNPTLDGLKLARLASKTVNNARVTYENRTEWKTVSPEFDELSTFKMSIETFVKTVNSDVSPYFNAWKTYNKWEMGLNRQQRFKKARQLESTTGLDLIDDETGKIKDISQFIKLAMVKVESVTIPNSRKVYTPWVPRVLPPDPEDYWGWSTVGFSPLKEGDVVMTEYGPGKVEWVKENNCRVNCYGDRFYILPRTMIVKPNPKRQLELNAIIKDPLKWHALSLDAIPLKPPVKPKKENIQNATPPIPVKGPQQTPNPKPVEPSPVKGEKEEEEKLTLDVVPLIINGFPAIVVRDDVPDLKKISGWNRVDPYISIQFKTWTAIDKFLDQLNEKFFIEQKLLDILDSEMELLRTGKTLTQVRRVNPADLRNFVMEQKRPLGFKTLKSGKKEAIVRPYFLTVDRKVRLAFDVNSHDPSIIRFIRGLKGDPRVQQIVEIKTPIWFNVFNSISEARRDIANLSTIADFDKAQISLDLADIAREIKELAAPRRNPNI